MADMERLYEICEEVLSDESRLKEFLNCETMDEMYEYFLKRDGSISQDEFDTFIAEILENYPENELSQIDENNLDSVSGGLGNWGQKLAAFGLGAMSLLSSAGVSAKSISPASNTAGQVVSQTKNKLETVKEMAQKGWEKTSDWVKKHPKIAAGIGIAAAAVIAGGVTTAVKHHNNKSNAGNATGAPTAASTTATPGVPGASKGTGKQQKKGFDMLEMQKRAKKINQQRQKAGTPSMRKLPPPPSDEIELNQSQVKLLQQACKEGKAEIVQQLKNIDGMSLLDDEQVETLADKVMTGYKLGGSIEQILKAALE